MARSAPPADATLDLALPAPARIAADAARALDEDMADAAGVRRDLTAELLPDGPALAHVRCKEPAAVLAGAPWFDACVRALDPDARIHWRHPEGARLAAGDIACTIEARARAIVSAERSALNFLQTLSGTATEVRRWVDALAGTTTRVLDTRKTLPGLRHAQKYAVRAGGGHNHRMGLHDAVMLKENHIHAAGSIAAAVERARALHPGAPLIIEVETLAELAEALDARPTRILVDEFDDAMLADAVAMARGRTPLEVSGGVDLARARQVAEIGVDCVSVGALTKHVRAVDYSLRMGPPPGEA
jgi:nicotinate-nucleotide pyrophosphorylase (carboxylating)